MAVDKWNTVGARLHWVYANLAMADAAVSEGAQGYSRAYYMIRAKLFKGLRTGTMRVHSFLDDERLKMQLSQACCYCGVSGRLTLDHLVPRARGGVDDSDNIIWCCRSCNASKGMEDLLVWSARRGQFPPVYLLRRYLKLAILWCGANSLMDQRVDEVDLDRVPFALNGLPKRLPAPAQLRLWVTDLRQGQTTRCAP